MVTRNNREIVKEINVASNPEAGSRIPAGKVDNERDALGDPVEYEQNAETVRDAEVKTGVATKCMHQQAGSHMDNMTQAHSGER